MGARHRSRKPDWDLGAPGMREAWDGGDRSGFYPYPAQAAIGQKGA